MSIWSSIQNELFFHPLSCKNKEIYFDCISRLIDLSDELPTLYESDAKNCIIIYLRNCQFMIQDEDIEGEITRNNTNPDNAGIILNYFRKCGWISQKEIGRTGENMATVTIPCRKLVGALQQLFGEESGAVLTNSLFSMDEILKSALEKDNPRAVRPYTNVLKPLVDAESSLKNEFMTLRESIHLIMRSVMQMSETNALGQFLLRDEILDRFFNDYFFLKHDGAGPTYRSNINRRLRKVQNSDLYEKMQTEYVQLKKVDLDTARIAIEKQFAELKSFINVEYEQEEGRIDKDISFYYSLYQSRMSMVLSNGINMENMLDNILDRMKNESQEEREVILMRFAECSRLQQTKIIGRKSFTQRKKKKENTVNSGADIFEISDEEMELMTDELLHGTPDAYSIENVRTYLQGVIGNREKMKLEDCKIYSRVDAMMMAATIIYSGAEDFPYEVEFRDGTIQTDVAEISNFEIKRR